MWSLISKYLARGLRDRFLFGTGLLPLSSRIKDVFKQSKAVGLVKQSGLRRRW